MEPSAVTVPTIQRVLIVGAGWVGRQIAARMAQHGVSVWLYDRHRGVCEEALGWMHSIAEEAIESSSPAVCGDWLGNVQIAEAILVPSIDLVIESVPEQISLKKRVLSQLSAQYAAPTIIASNSSYFTPSVLSRFVSSPERFAHFHFHVPVQHESVADIVGCERTQRRLSINFASFPIELAKLLCDSEMSILAMSLIGCSSRSCGLRLSWLRGMSPTPPKSIDHGKRLRICRWVPLA